MYLMFCLMEQSYCDKKKVACSIKTLKVDINPES